MRYTEQGGTELRVNRESGQRALWITLRGRPTTAEGQWDVRASIGWSARGAEAEALLREMVMIAELWGVTTDAEAAR